MNGDRREELVDFIMRAKSATWNGDGIASLSYPPGLRDLQYDEPRLAHLDSYFGDTNFLGQEVVWHEGKAIWVMNYHGQIIRPETYGGARAGTTSQVGRQRVYDQGTFLGEHKFELEHSTFHMTTTGDLAAFSGSEWHEIDGDTVYRFDFHGGIVTS